MPLGLGQRSRQRARRSRRGRLSGTLAGDVMRQAGICPRQKNRAMPFEAKRRAFARHQQSHASVTTMRVCASWVQQKPGPTRGAVHRRPRRHMLHALRLQGAGDAIGRRSAAMPQPAASIAVPDSGLRPIGRGAQSAHAATRADAHPRHRTSALPEPPELIVGGPCPLHRALLLVPAVPATCLLPKWACAACKANKLREDPSRTQQRGLAGEGDIPLCIAGEGYYYISPAREIYYYTSPAREIYYCASPARETYHYASPARETYYCASRGSACHGCLRSWCLAEALQLSCVSSESGTRGQRVSGGGPLAALSGPRWPLLAVARVAGCIRLLGSCSNTTTYACRFPCQRPGRAQAARQATCHPERSTPGSDTHTHGHTPTTMPSSAFLRAMSKRRGCWTRGWTGAPKRKPREIRVTARGL